MSKFKKNKFKIFPILIGLLFLLTATTSVFTALLPSTPVFAIDEAQCKAGGGTWQPQDTATGREYYCTLTDAQQCALTGGIWAYSGSSMTCLPAGSSSDVGGHIDATAGWTPQQKVMSAIYLRSLVACMFSQGKETQIAPGGSYITSTMILNNNDGLFPGGGSGYATSVMLDSQDDGILNCNNEGGWLTDALTLWQIPSKSDLLCILGYARGTSAEPPTKENSLVGYNACVKGGSEYSFWHTGYSVPSDTTGTTYTSTVTKSGVLTRLSNARGITMNLDNAYTYLLYKYVFETGGASGKVCGGTQYVKHADANADQLLELASDKAVKVKVVEIPEGGKFQDAHVVEYIYRIQDGSTQNTTVAIAPYVQGSPLYESSPAQDGKNTCGYIVKAMNELVTSYLKAVQDGLLDNNTATKPPSCEELDNCAKGSTTCAVPGIGWIVCPVFNLLAQISDATYNVIKSLLQVSPAIFDTNSGTYNGWLIARNIANIGFVIMFLFIIISQVSSVGISNYGVKKMLPRLIVAVILVNASYFVCQLAVDLSNILGGSIKNILGNLPVFAGNEGFWSGSSPLGNITGEILTGGIAVAGIAIVGVAAVATGVGLLIPVLLGALLAVAITFLILIGRQAVIVLLVVIAPLAFLAMLLPNTESFFKQWRKFFVAMLMLFPMIALLYGGARLAGAILLTALADLGFIAQLAAAVVAIVPLIATPVLLKGSLNAIPALGNIASRLQGRANGLMGRKAGELYKSSDFARGRAIRKQARENYRSQKFAERVKEGGLSRLMASGLPTRGAGAYANKTLERTAISEADLADKKDVQAEMDLMTANQVPHAELAKIMQEAYASGDTVKARAAQSILLKNEKGRRVFHGAMAEIEAEAAARGEDITKNDNYKAFQRNIKFNFADIKGVDAAIDQFGNGGTLSGPNGTRSTVDYLGLSDGQLAGQPPENLEVIRDRLLKEDPGRAQRMLDNDNLKDMSPGARQFFTEIAAQAKAQSGGAGGSTPVGPVGSESV